MANVALPKKISLLDDLLLPPRKGPTPPPVPEQFVERSHLYGSQLALGDEGTVNYYVYAPALEDLQRRCSSNLWSVVVRICSKLFGLVRTLPLDSVVAAFREDEQYRQLVDGKCTDKEALTAMGLEVLESRDSVSWKGGEGGPRIAMVHLDGQMVQVHVDVHKGPLHEGVSEAMGYCGKAEGHRFGDKPWGSMTCTEREVWLIMVAKHKVAFEEKKAMLEEKELQRRLAAESSGRGPKKVSKAEAASVQEFWQVRAWSRH
mmetsp:Transcript_19298/g.60647  ORF Transcript_19298/g.60647 Transcript_19298/m.60647 type:complete len:260 (-) Transcript_19298:32-811(-)